MFLLPGFNYFNKQRFLKVIHVVMCTNILIFFLNFCVVFHWVNVLWFIYPFFCFFSLGLVIFRSGLFWRNWSWISKVYFFFPWYITNHGITVSIYKILSNILQIAYAFQATTSDIWLSIIANFWCCQSA